MRYEEVKPISKGEVLRCLSGTTAEATEALVRAALTIKDWRWVESLLVQSASDERLEVRRTALLGFGHIARLHGKLNLKRVVPLLQKYTEHPILKGTAEDALEDIALFIEPSSISSSKGRNE